MRRALVAALLGSVLACGAAGAEDGAARLLEVSVEPLDGGVRLRLRFDSRPDFRFFHDVAEGRVSLLLPATLRDGAWTLPDLAGTPVRSLRSRRDDDALHLDVAIVEPRRVRASWQDDPAEIRLDLLEAPGIPLLAVAPVADPAPAPAPGDDPAAPDPAAVPPETALEAQAIVANADPVTPQPDRMAELATIADGSPLAAHPQPAALESADEAADAQASEIAELAPLEPEADVAVAPAPAALAPAPAPDPVPTAAPPALPPLPARPSATPAPAAADPAADWPAAERALRDAGRHQREGRILAAEQSLTDALRIAPGHHAARERLALLKIGYGDLGGAAALLRTGHALAPGHVPFALLLGRLLVDHGDAPAARYVLETSSATSDDPELQGFLAALVQADGDHVRAAELYTRALHALPRRSAWWMGLAISLDAQQHRASALRAFEASLDLGTLDTATRTWVMGRVRTLRDELR